MFCRKCGKTLLDGDRFCSYCGAQVIERNETVDITGTIEEVIYNDDVNIKTPSTDMSSIKSIGEKAVETDTDMPKINLVHTWQDINDKGSEKQIPKWNLEGFPVPGDEPKKTEDIKVDWEKRELLRFEESEAQAAQAMEDEGQKLVAQEVKTPEPEIKDIHNREENIKHREPEEGMKIVDKREPKVDIFELFDKQMKEEETEINSRDTMVFKRALEEQESLEKELFKDTRRKREGLHTSEEDQIDKFYTFSKKNEEFQKLLDKEYERLKSESSFVPNEIKIPSNIEKLEINVPKDVLSDTGMQVADVDTRADGVRESINEEQKHSDTAAIQATPQKISKENTVSVSQTEPETIEAPIVSAKHIEESIFPNEKPLEMAAEQTDAESQNMEPAKAEFVKAKSSDPETLQDPLPVLPWDGMESPLKEFTDEDKGKKISPLAVVLTVIIILLAFEATVVGIKCFFPQSSAATFVNDKLGVTVNWIDALKNNKEEKLQKEAEEKAAKDKEEQEKAEEEAKAVSAAVPDPKPSENKAQLVAESLAYNTNIKSVSADDSLAYIENKDYGDKNINNSQIIENNIWYQDENGNAVYYDKEIVKTIIQFDSLWIDYVNKKDEAVFQLVKEGGTAYKNAKSFSKAGKVTETFDILKIGDIRQGNKGFYVWVYEEITVTEKNKPKTVAYNYIYYMEPVDKQLKIVNYKQI